MVKLQFVLKEGGERGMEYCIEWTKDNLEISNFGF